MAVDVQRHVASDASPRRKWWQRTFRTRDAALRPRGYFMTGQDATPALLTTSGLYGSQIGIPSNAEIIILTAELQTVRYGVGFMPTSSYGNPLAAGTSIQLTLVDPDDLCIIAGTAGAVAHIQCYRVGDA